MYLFIRYDSYLNLVILIVLLMWDGQCKIWQTEFQFLTIMIFLFAYFHFINVLLLLLIYLLFYFYAYFYLMHNWCVLFVFPHKFTLTSQFNRYSCIFMHTFIYFIFNLFFTKLLFSALTPIKNHSFIVCDFTQMLQIRSRNVRKYYYIM